MTLSVIFVVTLLVAALLSSCAEATTTVFSAQLINGKTGTAAMTQITDTLYLKQGVAKKDVLPVTGVSCAAHETCFSIGDLTKNLWCESCLNAVIWGVRGAVFTCNITRLGFSSLKTSATPPVNTPIPQGTSVFTVQLSSGTWVGAIAEITKTLDKKLNLVAKDIVPVTGTTCYFGSTCFYVSGTAANHTRAVSCLNNAAWSDWSWWDCRASSFGFYNIDTTAMQPTPSPTVTTDIVFTVELVNTYYGTTALTEIIAIEQALSRTMGILKTKFGISSTDIVHPTNVGCSPGSTIYTCFYFIGTSKEVTMATQCLNDVAWGASTTKECRKVTEDFKSVSTSAIQPTPAPTAAPTKSDVAGIIVIVIVVIGCVVCAGCCCYLCFVAITAPPPPPPRPEAQPLNVRPKPKQFAVVEVDDDGNLVGPVALVR